ncbi:riboflavin kinase [Candidatus Gracilibacteria bacterium]|nr:riboflavin kinase [Candidatus Gracilibacteria bacterium]MCF7856356.1 riboflavin kinase [Candidatus Gracilibacteria bacterium]MCF7896745.1 riboflavin kinase [Candidatus Gracilibacteria bacterium]
MRFKGEIIPGRGVGRNLGFPTLNFEIPENFDSEEGVFAAQLFLGEQKFPAILFFGNRQTFDGVKSLEIHVLEKFDESPASAEFEILGKIREVKKFANEAELKKQIATDCETAREILGVR